MELDTYRKKLPEKSKRLDKKFFLKRTYGNVPYLSVCNVRGGKVDIVTQPTACRESMNSNYQTALQNDRLKGGSLYYLMYYRSYDKRARISLIKRVQLAVDITNLFSGIHGWPKAVLHDIKPTLKFPFKTTVNSKFMLIKASARWAKAPQLLSLFGLLLRSNKLAELMAAKSFDAFFDLLNVYNEKLATNYSFIADKRFLSQNPKLLKRIFTKYNTVFGKQRLTDMWNPAVYRDHSKIIAVTKGAGFMYNTTYKEGITRLLSGTTANYALMCAVKRQATAIGLEYKSTLYKSE